MIYMRHHYVDMTLFFFFNDTATTEIYTLSLHDALPISAARSSATGTAPSGARSRSTASRGCSTRADAGAGDPGVRARLGLHPDRKSTRLNSSHANLVCRLLLEKKKKTDHLLTSLNSNSS